MGTGCAVGWLSLALPLLQSDENPLHGKLTIDEVSWIGSVMSLGSIAGNILFGLIVSIIGSRNCIFLIGLPQLVRVLSILFTKCYSFERKMDKALQFK